MADKKKTEESKMEEIKEKVKETVKEKFEDCKEKASEGVDAVKEKTSEVVKTIKGDTEEEAACRMLITFALMGAWGSGLALGGGDNLPAALLLGGDNSPQSWTFWSNN